MLSVITYVVVILYSGGLAVDYLFIARSTRQGRVERQLIFERTGSWGFCLLGVAAFAA
jgi:hypothetical protein